MHSFIKFSLWLPTLFVLCTCSGLTLLLVLWLMSLNHVVCCCLQFPWPSPACDTELGSHLWSLFAVRLTSCLSLTFLAVCYFRFVCLKCLVPKYLTTSVFFVSLLGCEIKYLNIKHYECVGNNAENQCLELHSNMATLDCISQTLQSSASLEL